MNKQTIIASVISLFLVLSLLPALQLDFGKAQNAIPVIGIISSNTTWTKANSPYNLTGPTAVKQGATLKIEAGTIVNLNSFYILVNGTLLAQGSSTEKINFNGGSSPPSWAITLTALSGNSIIENVILSSPSTGISITGVTPRISGNIISAFYAIDIYEASPVISNNTINGAIGVHYASPTITNNSIKGDISAYTSSGYGNTVISNNTIEGGINCASTLVSDNIIYGSNEAGINAGQNTTIERNLIMNNQVGIDVSWSASNPIIRYNTITNNSVGIEISYESPSPTISQNNIQNNLQYNIQMSHTSKDVIAENNWWGTTDSQTINQTIYDSKNDFNLGTVNFVPFLNAPNPQAPAIPAVTPSPTPTPTPSASPIQTSTPTESTSPNTNPSPTVPEFPSWIILSIVLVAVPLMAVLTNGKRNRNGRSRA